MRSLILFPSVHIHRVRRMNLFEIISVVAVAACLSCASVAAQEKDSTAVADSLLLLQLQRSMQPAAPAVQAPPAPSAAPRSTLSTNPDLSAIGDFRSSYTNIGPRKVDLYFNQLELQISSVVDPYARADFMYSFSKDMTTGELGSDLEIATLTSLTLPYQLQLTLGKFKPVFGKINVLHPHAFSFVDFPKMTSNYFDEEGMSLEGASLSWLVPNPYDFYQELTIETGRVGAEPNASFVRGENSQLSYASHLKNFFDMTQNSTLEFGISGLNGPNRFGYSTTIGGLDLTYKWKPVQSNVLQSFTWQSELLLSSMRLSDANLSKTHGAYSLAEYQFAQRWFVGGRYDFSEYPGDASRQDIAETALLRFQPTEFQIVALELQHTDRNYDRSTNQVIIRFIFGIGTHAAHQVLKNSCSSSTTWRRIVMATKIIRCAIGFLTFCTMMIPSHSFAQLKVVTTLTDLQSITKLIGGDQVDVFAIASGFQNPHFVDPKPSYILKLARADVFVNVGLDLEIGWVPPLLNTREERQDSEGRRRIRRRIDQHTAAAGPDEREQRTGRHPRFWQSSLLARSFQRQDHCKEHL